MFMVMTDKVVVDVKNKTKTFIRFNYTNNTRPVPVPKSQAVKLAEKLKANGVITQAELNEVKG